MAIQGERAPLLAAIVSRQGRARGQDGWSSGTDAMHEPSAEARAPQGGSSPRKPDIETPSHSDEARRYQVPPLSGRSALRETAADA